MPLQEVVSNLKQLFQDSIYGIQVELTQDNKIKFYFSINTEQDFEKVIITVVKKLLRKIQVPKIETNEVNSNATSKHYSFTISENEYNPSLVRPIDDLLSIPYSTLEDPLARATWRLYFENSPYAKRQKVLGDQFIQDISGAQREKSKNPFEQSHEYGSLTLKEATVADLQQLASLERLKESYQNEKEKNKSEQIRQYYETFYTYVTLSIHYQKLAKLAGIKKVPQDFLPIYTEIQDEEQDLRSNVFRYLKILVNLQESTDNNQKKIWRDAYNDTSDEEKRLIDLHSRSVKHTIELVSPLVGPNELVFMEDNSREALRRYVIYVLKKHHYNIKGNQSTEEWCLLFDLLEVNDKKLVLAEQPFDKGIGLQPLKKYYGDKITDHKDRPEVEKANQVYSINITLISELECKSQAYQELCVINSQLEAVLNSMGSSNSITREQRSYTQAMFTTDSQRSNTQTRYQRSYTQTTHPIQQASYQQLYAQIKNKLNSINYGELNDSGKNVWRKAFENLATEGEKIEMLERQYFVDANNLVYLKDYYDNPNESTAPANIKLINLVLTYYAIKSILSKKYIKDFTLSILDNGNFQLTIKKEKSNFDKSIESIKLYLTKKFSNYVNFTEYSPQNCSIIFKMDNETIAEHFKKYLLSGTSSNRNRSQSVTMKKCTIM